MASLSVAELWASMEESSCRKRYGRDIMSRVWASGQEQEPGQCTQQLATDKKTLCTVKTQQGYLITLAN